MTEIPGQFEVRDENVEKELHAIGTMLREKMPKGVGFVFLMAHYGEGGGMFYTSNIERHDVCNMMREFIERAEPN